MTLYEILILQKESCDQMAKHYAEKGETKLSTFYHNAAEGFQIKANKLTLEEACQN